jgi:DNA-binding NarL/FixJ family response regulator
MMQKSDRSATKVLIVDDHPVVLSGCRSLFASDNTVKIEEATDAKSGHRAYLARKPDVTVIDIKLPDVSGFELMRRIRKDDPHARIIMFSMNDDPALVVHAIEMGAQGYVWKGDDPRMLVKAVRKVAAGDNFISPQLAEAVTFSGASIKANPASQVTARELEILRLLGRGDKIAEVANALEISYKTVANTTSLLKQKLGAKSHTDLIRIAVEMGAGLTPAYNSPTRRPPRASDTSKVCCHCGGPPGRAGSGEALAPLEMK